MSNTEILPVLLGSDANVYGMARSFHEEYGVRSIAISKTILPSNLYTKLIDFVLEPDLENPDKFLAKLIETANLHKDKKKVLVPCGDGYVKLAVQLQEKLSEYYCLNLLPEQLFDTLTEKDNFYGVCEKYGFDYPKTQSISYQDYKTAALQIQFPAIIKASNSVEYWKCSFEGRRKVFVAQDKAEFDRIVNAIYGSSYKEHLTIQEYIPGDDCNMRVLNCYVATDGKVKLMSLGQPLLEEHTPQGIGNYTAIISTCDEKLLEHFKSFLEDIGYRGFANFDMKYDTRDGKYKLFENNTRQGRASYYVTAAGYNLAKWLVDDVVYHKEQPLTIAKNEHLWIQVPKGVLKKYMNDRVLLQRALTLIKEGKSTNSLFYSKDMCLKRYIRMKLNYYNHYRKYKKYFGKKGMAE